MCLLMKLSCKSENSAEEMGAPYDTLKNLIMLKKNQKIIGI